MNDLASTFFTIAAFLSLLTLFAHEFLGAPLVLPPLKTSGLPASVIWLHHFHGMSARSPLPPLWRFLPMPPLCRATPPWPSLARP